MASVLEVLSGAGSLAGIVGAGYQIYTTRRERAERRQDTAPAQATAPVQATAPAPRQLAPATPRLQPPAAEEETWFDLLAPLLMAAYLWLMALGGFGYLDDPSLAGPTPEAVTTQLRYTVVLLAVNAVWAGALVNRHINTRPLPTRVWVYGLAGAASVVASAGLLIGYPSMIF